MPKRQSGSLNRLRPLLGAIPLLFFIACIPLSTSLRHGDPTLTTEVFWGAEQSGLRIGLRISRDKAHLVCFIQNVSEQRIKLPLLVYTRNPNLRALCLPSLLSKCTSDNTPTGGADFTIMVSCPQENRFKAIILRPGEIALLSGVRYVTKQLPLKECTGASETLTIDTCRQSRAFSYVWPIDDNIYQVPSLFPRRCDSVLVKACYSSNEAGIAYWQGHIESGSIRLTRE
jgi:hypothetical protein